MEAPVEPLYSIHPDLVRVGRGEYWNAKRGGISVVGPLADGILTLVATPSTASAAYLTASRTLSALTEGAFAHALETLVETGLVVAYEPAGAVGPDGRGGVFGAPVLPLAEATRCSDFVVIGAPYDAGVSNLPGCRFGPAAIRKASPALFQYRSGEGGPEGMYDPITERRVLEGVRIADVGDFQAVVHRSNGPLFDDIEEVTFGIASSGAIPVVLGGDHSVALPAIKGVARAIGAVGVLHLDAHDDFGTASPPSWRENLHHGNFMNWVVAHPSVETVVQAGVRQLLPHPPPPTEKLTAYPGAPLPETVPFPDGLPVYVTIDVDVLDPSHIPNTGTPLPGGASPPELHRLVSNVAEDHPVVGIDIVELVPGPHGEAGALVAAEVLLRALDAASRSHRAR